MTYNGPMGGHCDSVPNMNVPMSDNQRNILMWLCIGGIAILVLCLFGLVGGFGAS